MRITDKEAFGRRLRDLMLEKRVNQTTLAKDTGISKSNLSQYMSGRTAPTDVNQQILADYFGITVEELCNPSEVADVISEEALELARRYDALPKDSQRRVFVTLIEEERYASGIARPPVFNQKAPAELADAGVLGVQTATNRPLTPEEIAAIRRLLDQSKD